QIDLKALGKLVICEQTLDDRLRNIQSELNIKEIFYVGTCNRVEFIFTSSDEVNKAFINRFLHVLDMGLPEEYMEQFIENVSVFEKVEAFNHLLRISCSLESLVVGEKEILAQIRKAYEACRVAGFTGDYMRMIMNRVVKTAKEVYTNTNISKNPVSIVSLAYRKLRELNMCGNSRLLIIGAGETNKNIAQYLKKHKYSNFSIFNRTIEKAEVLAKDLNGTAYPLSALADYDKGFDVIITCTGATEPILTEEIYTSLLKGDTCKKVIVDLAIPNDTAPEVVKNFPLHYIEVDPQKIKDIKHKAINAVFADEINMMDDNSRAVLERVMDYMEKKCITIPMVMAKEILVKNS
ncbi:MAG: glutamyl-tRNA reductase, partial [Pedobacter sp.]